MAECMEKTVAFSKIWLANGDVPAEMEKEINIFLDVYKRQLGGRLYRHASTGRNHCNLQYLNPSVIAQAIQRQFRRFGRRPGYNGRGVCCGIDAVLPELLPMD